MQSSQETTCQFDACPKPLSAKGYCRSHYEQYRTGKPLRPINFRTTGTVAERLHAYTDRTGDCWLFTRFVGKDGYGRMDVSGKPQLAHRLAFAIAYGGIPEGAEVDHKCHTRHCVRPEHLQAVSHKENGENRRGPQRNSKSGIRGVSWDRQKRMWDAVVGHEGNLYRAGLFETVSQAEEAVVALRNSLFTNNILDRVDTPAP